MVGPVIVNRGEVGEPGGATESILDRGRLLFALVAASSLIPTTTSLKAAHGYSSVRAVLTWVIPIVLNVLVVIGVVVMLSRAHR